MIQEVQYNRLLISLLSKHQSTLRDKGKITTRHRIRETCPYTRHSPTELPSLQTLCKSEIHRKLKFTTLIPESFIHNYTYSREATLAMPLPRTVIHSLLDTPCLIHTRSLYITPQLSQQSTMVYIRKDSMLYTAVLRKHQGNRDAELLTKYFLRQDLYTRLRTLFGEEFYNMAILHLLPTGLKFKRNNQ